MSDPLSEKRQNTAFFTYFLILILYVFGITYGATPKIFPDLLEGDSLLFHIVCFAVSLFFCVVLIKILEVVTAKMSVEPAGSRKITDDVFFAVSYKNWLGLVFIVLAVVFAVYSAGVFGSFVSSLLMGGAISVLMSAYYQERAAMKIGFLKPDYILLVVVFSCLSLFYLGLERHLARIDNPETKVVLFKLILGGSFGFFSTMINQHLTYCSEKLAAKKLKALSEAAARNKN